MRKCALLGALVVGLSCLAGDAMAKAKKKEAPDETVAAAEKGQSEAASPQTATAPPPAATAPAPTDPAAQRDLAASCAKMIGAAPDEATRRSIMQTCSQQLGGAQGSASVAPEPPRPAPEPSKPTPLPTEDAAAAQDGKPRTFMLNFRAGYVPPFTFGASSGSGSSSSLDYPPQAMLGLEFAFAIRPNAYLILPLSFQFVAQTAMIMIPVGFQYDLALPVKNLYVTPRLSMGYVADVISINLGSVGGGSSTAVGHAGVVTPEIGLKYVLRERLNLGIDLLSIPIVFNPSYAQVFYRVAVYLGANF